MKCKECGGKGKIKEYVCGEWLGNYVTCGFCHGKGEVVQTNEEWFCGLSTEEKAEWLSNRDEFIYDCGQRSLTPKIMDKDEWEEWLKQPHTTRS